MSSSVNVHGGSATVGACRVPKSASCLEISDFSGRAPSFRTPCAVHWSGRSTTLGQPVPLLAVAAGLGLGRGQRFVVEGRAGLLAAATIGQGAHVDSGEADLIDQLRNDRLGGAVVAGYKERQPIRAWGGGVPLLGESVEVVSSASSSPICPSRPG